MDAVKSKLEREKKRRGRWAVLGWAGKARVAGVDALAEALEVTPRQVWAHGAWLEQHGFVERPRMGDGGGGVIVVKPKGIRELGLEVRSGTPPRAEATLLHGRGVSWIAADCEQRGRTWFGPTELEDWKFNCAKRGSLPPKTHLADLGFLDDRGERWAAEFERFSKGRDRWRQILAGYRSAQLRRELKSVLYVCGSTKIAELIEELAAEAKINRVVWTLEELIERVRGGEASPGTGDAPKRLAK